jgi:photosystem II stability/assembly factor-like uncharacterized protein
MKRGLTGALLIVAALLAACARASPNPPTPATTALATPGLPAATLSPASPTTVPAPTATQGPAPPRSTPVSAATPAPGAGPLPALLAQISLAPPGSTLTDLLLDRDANRLYVTDSSGQLHVLDGTTYAELATLPASGDLVLDAAHGRLYISLSLGEGAVSVFDTASLRDPLRLRTGQATSAAALVGSLEPPGAVAVDPVRNRFYVGNRIFAPGLDERGVRVYDAATLEQVGEVPQPGMPVFNPLRDELLIVGYSVYRASPETLQVSGDLLPEITAQPAPGCSGCLAATGAQVYPDRNLLVVDITELSAGKGPGTLPPPRFFDATTLAEISSAAGQPGIARACNGRMILAEPVGGRVYRSEAYSRYAFFNNLSVYDLDGRLLTWRDGLSLGITNPATGQMVVPGPDGLLVLDLPALSPVGVLGRAAAGEVSAACLFSVDAETGRIYAAQGGDLAVFSPQGAWPAVPPAEASPLPAEQVAFIQPSPDYARDHTLFLGSGGDRASQIFRSTDGGRTWQRLRGGLPEGLGLSLDLALSPDYAHDHTLFVGGFWGDAWGEGVLRSTDGGDTWQPLWSDLAFLRVYDVALSPDYAADGTLLAYSRYQRITPWQPGQAVFRSADRGLHWTLVMTAPLDASLPPPEDLLPPSSSRPALRFRTANSGRSVERSTDGGQTWQAVVVSRQPDFQVQAILLSPNVAADHTVYVLSSYALFRSTDGGEKWEHCTSVRPAGFDSSRRLTAGALAPSQAGGRHLLFIGRANGRFRALDPARLTWEPVRSAAQWPTVLEGERVSAIEPAPNGDVWLGTWGTGLARYAGGTIQARYTVADGLSSQYIGGIAVAPDGQVWAGGDLPPGVASFDGQSWTLHPFPSDEAIGGVFDVAAAPDGAIWVGAQAGGLLKWKPRGWRVLSDMGGLVGGRIYDIAAGPGGTLWCATSNGLVLYEVKSWSGFSFGESRGVEVGPDGAVYLLTGDRGVERYAGGQWIALPAAPGLIFNTLALHVAGDGAVWLGTYAGAFRYDGQSWRQFTAQDGLPDNEVYAVAEDTRGQLWFGTAQGAAHLDPSTLNLSPVAWTPLPTPAP